jgi:hypothetical protein
MQLATWGSAMVAYTFQVLQIVGSLHRRLGDPCSDMEQGDLT